MRRFSALVASLLVVTALAGCTGSAITSPAPCGVTSGNASSAVDAVGDVGSAPEVSFPTPLLTRTLEKSVLQRGSSAPLQDGQPVILEATILSGDDGSVLQQTAYAAESGSLLTVGDTQLEGLGEALECATLGSRIAVVLPAVEGATGAPGEQSVVYVVDVLRAFHSRADGAPQVPQSGMPSVVTAPDGTPGITVPNEDAPTDFREAVLKLGDGAKVAEGDLVVAKLTAVDWETGNVATAPASTWATGGSAILDLGQGADALGAGLVNTLVGATVGSQVISVVPPGLGATSQQGVAPTGTLVYVVDILGTV